VTVELQFFPEEELKFFCELIRGGLWSSQDTWHTGTTRFQASFEKNSPNFSRRGCRIFVDSFLRL